MKKLLLGSVALVALGTVAPAIAADMGVARRPVAYVAASNWTGCHIGGSFGDAWGRSPGYSATPQSTFGVVAPPPAPTGQQSGAFDLTGAIMGVYAGCDYQAGAWVFGVEGDWSKTNKEGQSFVTSDPNTIGIFGPGYEFSAKERWLATLRGRLGYAVDKWLLFVSGGAAWMSVDNSEHCGFITAGTFCTAALLPLVGSALLQTDRVRGYTVGAGIDYALSYGWSVRSEYLYVKIRDYTTFSPGTLVNGLPQLNVAPTFLSTKLTNNIFRFGLAYKFGDYAAAVVTK
jgi:outer membrane immunogenic protein